MIRLSEVFHKNQKAFLQGKRYIINQGGTSCFVGNQKIITKSSTKAIQDIKTGDSVLSYNEKKNINEYAIVKNIYRYKNTKQAIHIRLKNGELIEATDDHKVYFEGGWYSLKHMIQLWNDRNMESNTRIYQIRGFKFWKLALIKLQKLKNHEGIKASNIKRWLHANDATRRHRKVSFLESTQVYHTCFLWFKRRIGNKSYKRSKDGQQDRELRTDNKIRKLTTCISNKLNRAKARFFKRNVKNNRIRRKVYKGTCKQQRSILWAKSISNKIWCVGRAHKRHSNKKKKCLASCISIDDIALYYYIKVDFVYDIEIENNHNYYLDCIKPILVHNSTKTFSILQLLVDIARKTSLKIDILGQSVPQLKDGVLTDMPMVCDGFGKVFDEDYSISDKIYKPGPGTMHFLSIDKLGKSHGGRRDILYINEAQYIPWAIVEQLMIRTRLAVFIDYNPTGEFWAQTQIMTTYPNDYILIKSTYLDNEWLEDSIVKAIEAKKGNNNFWRVYGLGEMGRSEGLIFDNFKTNQVFDKEQFADYRHGVDWGFSVDPFAYNRIAIDKKRMKIYICDEINGKNMQNNVSAPMVKAYAKYQDVVCDSAEPKSVSEFCSLGVNAKGAKKGQGSVETGIKYIQRFEVIIHKDCPHTAEEFNNYAWKMDRRTGEPLNVPDDSFNHHIDAIRYSLENDMGGVSLGAGFA